MRKKATLLTLLVLAGIAASAGNRWGNVSAEEVTDRFDISTLELRGDINNDGIVDVMDQMRYKRHLLESGNIGGSDYQKDVNSDGNTDFLDVDAVKKSILKAARLWSPKNIPVMDGSTSAIPLEAGFKSKMLGINYFDAKSSVKHHKTHESFQMLLSGQNDMIFTVPISESQQKDADEAGVHLNLEPVAKEGFVFIVNKSNPVDKLTQQQIRDIYSGKITNWSEVGGNDEEIIPYQRNQDSGSQNYMNDFMNGYELMTPPKEYTLSEMGTLMDAIAVYDNSKEAIGYSVYSYAAQMYENSSDVKFIAVDGVKPSRETMADNSYPLLSSTYIMYTDNASQNTLDFVKWAVSEEGQTCVLENGYVPVVDMEYPDRFRLYNAKGTGKEKPADYKPDVRSSYISKSYYSGCKEYPDMRLFRINFLKDKNFQREINADIEKAVSGLEKDISVEIYAENGYLSVLISKDGSHYLDNYIKEKNDYDKVITLNYDLINSRKIEKFSDLFYKDADFVQTVNDSVSSYINEFGKNAVKTDFLGITDSVDSFTLSMIRLNKGNPYLDQDYYLYINRDDSLEDLMVKGEYYDLRKVCDERFIDIGFTDTIYSSQEWNTEIIKDKDGEYREVITSSRFHTDEEVAERNRVYDIVFSSMKEIRSGIYGDDKYRISVSSMNDYSDKTEMNIIAAFFRISDHGNKIYYFDLQTGEQIKFSDIFGKEFEYLDNDISSFELDDTNEKTVRVYLKKESVEYGSTETVIFDPEHLNEKYIKIKEKKEKPEIIKIDGGYTGEVKWDGYDINAYASSYVVDGGPEEVRWPIEGAWHITAKQKCFSHNTMWYDCYDTDDGDHYGWISEYYLAFYRDDALSSITGNVFSYYDDRDGFTTNFMLCQDGMLYGESSKYERNPEDKSTHIYYSGFNGYLTDAVKKDDLTLTASVDTMTVNNDRAPYIRKDMVITEKKDVIESGDELIIYLKGSDTSKMDEKCIGLLKKEYERRCTLNEKYKVFPDILEENVIFNVTENTIFTDNDGKYSFSNLEEK